MAETRRNATAERVVPRDPLCKVPVFRPVAIKLLSVLQGEEVDIFAVADLLNSDPGFAAELLTLANSAIYAIPHRVNTVERAIIVLGMERTRVLATRAALQGMMRGLEESAAVQNTWTHSRAVAIISGWLAPFYRVHPDRAYTAGLMHDIGRLGLLAAYSSRYAELLTKATGVHNDLMEAERLLSMDHCEAGQWLTKTWGLPEEFCLVAAHHHEPAEGSIGDQTDLVCLACSLAQSLGFKAAPLIEHEPLESVLEKLPAATNPSSRFCLTDLSSHLQSELTTDSGTIQ